MFMINREGDLTDDEDQEMAKEEIVGELPNGDPIYREDK